jgi:pimeloyl-ACP methyl ester carboxylesterase
MTGQDDNPSETVGFGPAEADLIRQTVRALKADRTILVGCSLGGAAVWLASDEPSVSAVVSDSAFARLDDACKSWLEKDLPGGDFLLRPVIWFGTARVGVKPSAVNPVEIARRWSPSRPALVIHGDQDRLFSVSHADDLAKASGAQLWLVTEKGHAQPVDDPTYLDRLDRVAKATK